MRINFSVSERCHRCQSVFPADGVQILEAMGKTWHIQCFRYVHVYNACIIRALPIYRPLSCVLTDAIFNVE